jgi:hypothetical protein
MVRRHAGPAANGATAPEATASGARTRGGVRSVTVPETSDRNGRDDWTMDPAVAVIDGPPCEPYFMKGWWCAAHSCAAPGTAFGTLACAPRCDLASRPSSFVHERRPDLGAAGHATLARCNRGPCLPVEERMQPSQSPAPAAQPTQAPPPATGAPVAATQPALMPGVPRTAQEMAALRSTRSQLSEQIRSAERRRDEISKELRGEHGEPPLAPEDRAGLVERLRVLDARILQIESDIASTGRAMAMAPANLQGTSATTQAGRDPMDRLIDRTNPTAISAIFSAFVLAPIALAYARRIWRRPVAPVPHGLADTPQRLERMEHAIDAIAVEVERIAEGQRFVTRLIGEANGLSEIGAARTVGMDAQQEALPLPRGER